MAYVPRTARIVRASALSVRELEYVDAARANGAGSLRIILRHLLPNCVGPLLVQPSFVFAYAILAEAALSFLGIGPPPPTPSWGNIVAEGQGPRGRAWWIMLIRGIGISLAGVGMNLVGDGPPHVSLADEGRILTAVAPRRRIRDSRGRASG